LAFKIALLAESCCPLIPVVTRQFGEHSFEIVHLKFDAAIDISEQLCEFVQSETPKVFLSLGFDSSDVAYLNALGLALDFLKEADLPIIHCGSHYSLDVSVSELLEDDLLESRFTNSPIAKLEAKLITLPKHILLRCGWMLDIGERSLFSTLIPMLLGASRFQVSEQSFGCPVSEHQVARTLVSIVRQVVVGADNWGSYHLRSADKCSEAEFADYLSRALKAAYGELLLTDFDTNASQELGCFGGANANLHGRRLTDDFGIQMVTWRKGFAATLDEWVAARGYLEGRLSPQTSS